MKGKTILNNILSLRDENCLRPLRAVASMPRIHPGAPNGTGRAMRGKARNVSHCPPQAPEYVTFSNRVHMPLRDMIEVGMLPTKGCNGYVRGTSLCFRKKTFKILNIS